METNTKELTVKEYAQKEGISLQCAYRHLWEGRITRRKFLDRWLISVPSDALKEKTA